MKMERWEKVSGRRLAIIFSYLLVSTATSSDGREWDIAGEEGGAGGHERAAPFLLKETRVVSKTEGGEIRVFKSPSWNGRPPRILVSFVTMEANTLLIPHYMDADLILFLFKNFAGISPFPCHRSSPRNALAAACCRVQHLNSLRLTCKLLERIMLHPATAGRHITSFTCMQHTCLRHIHHLPLLKPQPFMLPITLNLPHSRKRNRERKMEKWKQGSGLLAAIFFSLLMAAAAAENRGEWNVPGGHDWSQFLLKKSEVVTKTEAGEIRVFRGHSWNGHPPRLHIGFVTLEPSSQLIPVYLDADLILFVQRGEVKIGWIHEDDLVERQLKAGAVLRIPAGSIFYYVNNNEHQLQIIAGIEPVGTDLIDDLFTPFYVGGGELPPSALAGFDLSTLTTAFNATPEEVRALTAARFGGSIINIISEDDDNHLQRFAGAMNSAMGKLKQGRKLTQNDEVKTKESTKEACTWSSIFSSFFFGETATENNKIQLRADDPVEAPDAYNIYDHDPNFKNDYGYTVEVNEHDYSPLKHSDISVYLVNISAGSILAPHVNPRATEYGIVIAGSGTVEIVNPNGTKALKAEVTVGDVFWVPRFYPFAYVAGREGPLVILGFTTSSRKNRAQFLAGKGSTLSLLIGKELAAGFGVTEEELKQLVHKQVESVILPSWE